MSVSVDKPLQRYFRPLYCCLPCFFHIIPLSCLLYTSYIATNIWQTFGWNSIIYLAALAGVDIALYESARVDGANRFQQMLHITLPCIIPTIIIMLVLNMGNIMSVGFEKIILMYSPSTYEVAEDVYKRQSIHRQDTARQAKAIRFCTCSMGTVKMN